MIWMSWGRGMNMIKIYYMIFSKNYYFKKGRHFVNKNNKAHKLVYFDSYNLRESQGRHFPRQTNAEKDGALPFLSPFLLYTRTQKYHASLHRATLYHFRNKTALLLLLLFCCALFCLLRQGLTWEPRLVWDSLCSSY